MGIQAATDLIEHTVPSLLVADGGGYVLVRSQRAAVDGHEGAVELVKGDDERPLGGGFGFAM